MSHPVYYKVIKANLKSTEEKWEKIGSVKWQLATFVGFCTTRFLTKVTLIVAVKLSLLLHSICHSNSVFFAVWRRNTTSMLTQVMTHVFVFMLMYCDDIKYTFTYNGIFVCFKAVIVNRLTLRNWTGCSVLFFPMCDDN